MSAIALSGIAFVCIAGGVLLGMFLRNTLPEHHLNSDAKDVVRLGTGLIGTIAALVLGLLIGSAKSSYDLQSAQIKQMTAISFCSTIFWRSMSSFSTQAPGGRQLPATDGRSA